MRTILGKIIPTAAGDWNSSTTYEKLTTIWHAPSLCAYISKTLNTNKQPNLNPSDWQKITDVSSAYNYALDKGTFALTQGNYANTAAQRAEDAATEAKNITNSKINKNSISQKLGNSETDIMSQKAVSDEINKIYEIMKTAGIMDWEEF